MMNNQNVCCMFFDLLPSSYLQCLRAGVGWHVMWCARCKRGLVQRLAEVGAKDVVGGGGGGGGEAGGACAQKVCGQFVGEV
jgi:hypothetical protein